MCDTACSGCRSRSLGQGWVLAVGFLVSLASQHPWEPPDLCKVGGSPISWGCRGRAFTVPCCSFPPTGGSGSGVTGSSGVSCAVCCGARWRRSSPAVIWLLGLVVLTVRPSQCGESDAVFYQEVFDPVSVGSGGDSYHDDPVAVGPSELLDFGCCRPAGRSPRRQEPQQHRPGTVHQRPQTDRLPADCFYHFAFGKVVAHPAPPREGIFVLEHRLVNQGGSPVSGQQPVGAEPERLDAASGTDTGRG